MKKVLFFAWLLLVSMPVIFTPDAICSAKVEEGNFRVEEDGFVVEEEENFFDDFNIDELELALDQTNLEGQELVKPPSFWVIWFRRVFSPIGVALIKLCDTIRDNWQNTVETSA